MTSCALSEGYVTFWARDRLFCKMEDLIRQAEGCNTLRSSRMYGRVGCGGLAALCDRQGSRDTAITEELRDCFHLIRAILSASSREAMLDLPAPSSPLHSGE